MIINLWAALMLDVNLLYGAEGKKTEVTVCLHPKYSLTGSWPLLATTHLTSGGDEELS